MNTIKKTVLSLGVLIATQFAVLVSLPAKAEDINLNRAIDCEQEMAHISVLDMVEQNPELKTVLYPGLVKDIVEDPEMSYYSEMLKGALTGAHTPDQFIDQLKQKLVNKVPKASIDKRLSALVRNPTVKLNLLRALGDMELREVQALTYGEDLKNPSPDSLLGQYIAETGAKTLLRSFAIKPPITNLDGLQGPQRMVVPVSPASFAAYQKYFYNHNFMTNFGHAQVMQGGKVFSYNRSLADFILPHTKYTALPQILLSTSEAQRLEQYSQLFKPPYWYDWAHGDGKFIGMYPWAIAGYCKPGGYPNNCTQWIGNIPLGNRLVNEYQFPGDFEADEFAPRRVTLSQHKHPDALVQRVWKAPGHEQLADVLGQTDAALNAEFANPGWLISTLIGPTSNERVPLLFVVVEDHTSEIPAGFTPNFEEPF